jgi:hypothetical protein
MLKKFIRRRANVYDKNRCAERIVKADNRDSVITYLIAAGAAVPQNKDFIFRSICKFIPDFNKSNPTKI